MSEARLELVELCEHGEAERHCPVHIYLYECGHNVMDQCRGGSRRVLSVPTEEMVEVAAKTYVEAKYPMLDLATNVYDRELMLAALTAAFNTLGIQEKADTT
jgi:hypothetical protein